VTTVDFRAAVLRVMQDGFPSSGDNLLGMEMDFDGYLAQVEEIDPDSITVRSTQNAECLIRASCRAAPAADLTSAAEAVERAWMDVLRYSHLEAHDLRNDGESVLLEFVTQIRPSGFYVTGRVEILPNAPS
jgi:hypothetical protein